MSSSVPASDDGPTLKRTPDPGPRRRQAVLLIHGIGEQTPMGTLRPFVDSLLGNDAKTWSRPDPLSGHLELRRLVSRERPKTDFFEYYWAHHITGSSVWQVIVWALKLVWRRKSTVPAHLHPLWRLCRLLTLGIVLAFLVGLNAYSSSKDMALWFLFSGMLSVAQWFLLSYLGDAVQYLNPCPANILARQAIRQEGLRVLKAMHERDTYDRIIVVGHSLGSVIALDLLRFLWQEYHDVYRSPFRSDQAGLKSVVELGEVLRRSNAGDLSRYREAQARAWRELKSQGCPWLITDLITLGSPLAHAGILMADDAITLMRKKREREVPTSPPTAHEGPCFYQREPPFTTPEGPASLKVFDDGALFAVTRWTNLFFPVRWAIFGDLIAGPLQPVFGAGIRDVPVSSSKWRGLINWLPLSHVAYWEKSTPSAPDETSASPRRATAALRAALDLDSLNRWFSPKSEL